MSINFVKKKSYFLNHKGFTLIELISIMIIMGVLASVVIQKFDLLTDTASDRVLVIAVKELNIRESLVWTNMKISNEGYTKDEDVYAFFNTDLGLKLKWSPGPTIGGGTLHCESQSIVLNRTPSSNSSAGKWQ